MLDAPVSGSMATLEQGQMSVMVGGDAAAFERIRPVLDDIGPKVTHVGGNGAALVCKLAINLSLVVQVISFCESVAVAEKAGVEREAAVDAILKSVIASPVLGYRGALAARRGAAARRSPTPTCRCSRRTSCSGSASPSRSARADPFAAFANELLTATRAAGLGERDFVAVARGVPRLGGIE